MEIYQKVKLFFQEKGIKSKEIAEKYGVASQTMSHYLTGVNTMPLAFVVWLVNEYPHEIDLDALFKESTTNIVCDPPANYNTKNAASKDSKAKILERIGKILDEEM